MPEQVIRLLSSYMVAMTNYFKFSRNADPSRNFCFSLLFCEQIVIHSLQCTHYVILWHLAKSSEGSSRKVRFSFTGFSLLLHCFEDVFHSCTECIHRCKFWFLFWIRMTWWPWGSRWGHSVWCVSATSPTSTRLSKNRWDKRGNGSAPFFQAAVVKAV